MTVRQAAIQAVYDIISDVTDSTDAAHTSALAARLAADLVLTAGEKSVLSALWTGGARAAARAARKQSDAGAIWEKYESGGGA